MVGVGGGSAWGAPGVGRSGSPAGFSRPCPYPRCGTVQEVHPPARSDEEREFYLACRGCSRPRVYLFKSGQVHTERDPLAYTFCLPLKAMGGTYEEVADLFGDAIDYVQVGRFRGAAVLLRVATELWLAAHILGDPTEGTSLANFGPMIGRVRNGEGSSSGLPQEIRNRVCGYLNQIMLLGDTAAHPRLYPPARRRVWSRGHVIEDMDQFEKIVKMTMPGIVP